MIPSTAGRDIPTFGTNTEMHFPCQTGIDDSVPDDEYRDFDISCTHLV